MTLAQDCLNHKNKEADLDAHGVGDEANRNPLVSCIPYVKARAGAVGVGESLDDAIRSWTQDDAMRERTEPVRGIMAKHLAAGMTVKEAKEQDDYKAAKVGFPSHTYAALLRAGFPRAQAHILELSGFVPIDIDDIPTVAEAQALRDRLGEIPWVRAVRLSIGGHGVHGLAWVGGLRERGDKGVESVPAFKDAFAVVERLVLELTGWALDKNVSNPVNVLFDAWDDGAVDNRECIPLDLPGVEEPPIDVGSESTSEPPRRRTNVGPKPGDTGGRQYAPTTLEEALDAAGCIDLSAMPWKDWMGWMGVYKQGGFTLDDCQRLSSASAKWNGPDELAGLWPRLPEDAGKTPEDERGKICGTAYKSGWRKATGRPDAGSRVNPDHDDGESAPPEVPDVDQDASDYAVAVALIASTPGQWRLVGQHLYFARLGRPFAKLNRDDPRTFRAIFPALRDLVHSGFPTKIKALSDRYCLGIARMLDTMTETPDMEELVPRLRVSATIAPENLAIYAGGRITRVSDGMGPD